MKFREPIEGLEDEVNMAPMIDLVFLLLIFFMVTSQLTKIDRRPVELPEASKAIIPEGEPGRQMITIESKSSAGEEIVIYVNMKKVSLDEITPIIEKRFAENDALKVYLRADRYVKHKHVKAVMKACTDAGISDVIFATFESGN